MLAEISLAKRPLALAGGVRAVGPPFSGAEIAEVWREAEEELRRRAGRAANVLVAGAREALEHAVRGRLRRELLGRRVDSLIFVDGELDLDAGAKDAVMMFDPSATKGSS